MKTKTLLFLSLFAILTSCSKLNQYKEFVSFGEENHWQKAAAQTFEFDITDDVKLYNIVFKFSHVYDYQFASIPINFTIENPKGEKENFSVDLAIKDSSGKELAECSGDVCDLDYTIKEKTKLQKGLYKVTISHSFEGPYLPNVLGIGLNVESVK